MAAPLGKPVAGQPRAKAGAVSVGVTVTAAVVMASLRAWAAALTFTARVRDVPKSPVKARVRVAVVLPEVAPETCETETLGMSVTSSKLDAVTPAPNVVCASDTATVAVFRLASVSGDGLVEEIDAP